MYSNYGKKIVVLIIALLYAGVAGASQLGEPGLDTKHSQADLEEKKVSAERKTEMAEGVAYRPGTTGSVAAAEQVAKALAAIPGDLSMPAELIAMVKNPPSRSMTTSTKILNLFMDLGMPQIQLIDQEEKILRTLGEETRVVFAKDVWKELPFYIQRFLIDSGSADFTRRARVVFLRGIFESLVKFREEPKGEEKRVEEATQNIIRKIHILTDEFIIQKQSLQEKNLLSNFITHLFKKINTEDSYTTKQGQHRAMLYRLVQLLRNTPTNEKERKLLHELLAESDIDSTGTRVYERLAQLSSQQLSLLDNYATLPLYGALHTLKFWSKNPYPWDEQDLQKLAQPLQSLIDPYVFYKIRAQFAAKPDDESVFYKDAQDYLNKFYLFVLYTQKNRDAVSSLINLINAADKEQEQRKQATALRNPVPDAPAILLLNTLVQNMIKFGSQYTYEELLFMHAEGKLSNYWQSIITENIDQRWKNAAHLVASKKLLNEKTIILINDSKKDRFKKKRAIITKMRFIFDEALEQHNSRALNHLLYLVTFFDKNGNPIFASKVKNVDRLRKEIAIIKLQREKLLEGKPVTGYQELLKFPEVQRWSFTFSLSDTDWIKKWHEAVQYWYDVPLDLDDLLTEPHEEPLIA